LVLWKGRVLRSFASVLLCMIGVSLPASAGAQHPVHGITGTSLREAHASVWSEHGVASGRAVTVAAEIDGLFRRVGHDLEAAPPRLQIRLFASHRTFALALRSLQGTHPQSSTDDTSAVEHGTLLLGPLPAAYLRHNLAHVYTEWIIDRLTGNRTDALPSTPWLYDGLAEYEAYRYAPAGMRCRLSGSPPFDITTVRTARQWMVLRAGPLGALEYCLAYVQTRALVDRVGWSSIRRTMHRGWGWRVVAHRLLRDVAPLLH
jgi:hypothetical protein